MRADGKQHPREGMLRRVGECETIKKGCPNAKSNIDMMVKEGLRGSAHAKPRARSILTATVRRLTDCNGA